MASYILIHDYEKATSESSEGDYQENDPNTPHSHSYIEQQSRLKRWYLLGAALCAIIFALTPTMLVLRKDNSVIPNVVHYVHIGPDGSTLRFDAASFLTFYSTYYHLRPKAIYIHTNLNWERASHDNITLAVKSIPSLKFRKSPLQHRTSLGVEIAKQYQFPHESDFIRTRVMSGEGGIYMDEDSFVLKDFTPLRKSGFAMLLGAQVDGRAACGVMLVAKGSLLMAKYKELQAWAYDGTWVRHAIDLLQKLAELYAHVPGAVQLLPSDTFYPFSWDKKSQTELFAPKNGQKYKSKPSLESFEDRLKTEKFDLHRDEHSKIAFSYAVHTFTSVLNTVAIQERSAWFGNKDGVIDFAYILRGEGLFAQLFRPVIEDAIERKVLAISTD